MFTINKENITTKYLLILISIAYLFSIAVRMIWVYQFSGYDDFHWNNQLMINTNDGYIWATSALNELTHQFENNPRLMDMYHYGVVFFTYIAVKILPFNIDSIILYMPAVISSLVVIPIILIARIYNLTIFGFFSALLGSIAWSYYNRTMVGYYDTDMFSAMAPMFILFFLIKTIEEEKLNNALYASLSILIYPFLYDSGLSIVYAMGLIYMGYMVIFHRKNSFTYQSIFLISLALLGIPIYIKFVSILVIYIIFTKKEFPLKSLIIVSLVGVLIFLISGNVFGLIWSKIASYGIRGEESVGLKFFQVAQTVREAGKIPFDTMANRISGSTVGVIVSFVGYILLVVKYRPMILALPLIGIGLFSLWGGLRFTVYAVPVAAMGGVFFIYVIGSYVRNNIAKYSVITILTALMIYPNIQHIIEYKVPTVFNKTEVKVLEKLKTISNPKDYTLAWWDYGYPIWYYSNTNTLIDGGKHKHDNFIISKILTGSSQLLSANLARLSVETYISSDYKIVADQLFKNRQKDQLDPNIFLDKLKSTEYVLPKKTRDIYFYLPYKMLNIFPTVSLFSNLNLQTGQQNKRPFFFVSRNFKQTAKGINLGSNIDLYNTGRIQIGNNNLNVNKIVTTFYDKKNKLHTEIQTIDKNSPVNVIFMKNYNTFLVIDNQVFNSVYIQLFVLENYDKSLFEPVILNPQVKIYKLKV